MIEAIAAGIRLRRARRLITRARAEEGSCDFGKAEIGTGSKIFKFCSYNSKWQAVT
jgi:hypothetical protein